MISRSQADVQPVLATIARSARALCDAKFGNVYLLDGETISLAASDGLAPKALAKFASGYPRKIGPDTVTGRAALENRVVQTTDLIADPDYSSAPGSSVGARSVLGVPMLQHGKAIGSIGVWRDVVEPFSASQVALLQTFADQAVIAIENVRLFTELGKRNRDLTEALEQQTATSNILRVISQSPTDVQPVFDTIAVAALKLCNASSAVVTRFDGELIRLAALANVSTEGADALRRRYPRPPGRHTANARAILTRTVVAIPDVLEDVDYEIGDGATAAPFRGILAVPLLRDGSPTGAISIARAEPGPFPETQFELLKTFADQAVIAIENVRLFTELGERNRDLTEALEQQTATSDILRVISQSQTDVQPVFDTIAKSVVALCRAQFANVFTYDGRLIHLAAFVNVHPEYIDMLRSFYPRPPGRATAVARAIESGSVCTIADVLADPEYQIADSPAQLARASEPVLPSPELDAGQQSGRRHHGREASRATSESQVMLLQTFADQAVIAIENVRLFTELEARTTELTQSVGELKALVQVGQAVSSTLDLETVLSTIVSRAAQLAGMDGGSIWEYDEASEEFYLRATDRLPEELVEVLRATPIRKGEGVLGRLALTGEPVEIPDIARESTYKSRVRRSSLMRLSIGIVVPLLYEEGRLAR